MREKGRARKHEYGVGDTAKLRKCLYKNAEGVMCNNHFKSSNPGHRMCPQCQDYFSQSHAIVLCQMTER